MYSNQMRHLLSDDVQSTLRTMKKITNNEVALKIGDLFVAENVIDKTRRQLALDDNLIESLGFKVKSNASPGDRKILKG